MTEDVLEALQSIVDLGGWTCDRHPYCGHRSCKSSAEAWNIAYEALAALGERVRLGR